MKKAKTQETQIMKIKFEIRWNYVIAGGKRFEINLIADSDSTFKNVVCPKLRDYLEDNEEATFKDLEKFLKENDYKVLNVYNTDNNGIINHYLIESTDK